MEVFALKQVEKTSEIDGKNKLENPLKILFKTAKTAPLYRLPKTSRWSQTAGQNDLSDDQPVDRPTVIFFTVGAFRSTVPWA